MVWNIEFQIAAFIIIAVTTYLCLIQKRLVFRTERYFMLLMYGAMVSIFLDIISIVTINYSRILGPVFTEVICEAYLLSLVTVGFLASHFACAEVNYRFSRILNNASFLPIIAEILVLVLFPTKICLDPINNSVYTEGMTVFVTYFFGIIYIGSTLAVMVIHKAEIAYRKRRAVYGWLISWLMAAAIQGINNRFLIASFAMSVGIVYMYTKIENPDYNLDDSLNIFNRSGFTRVMDDALRFKRVKPLIGFRIYNVSAIGEIFGTTAARAFVKKICNYLKTLPDILEFSLEDDMFAIIPGDDTSPEVTENIVDGLEKRFSSPWDVDGTHIMGEIGIVYLFDTSIFSNTREVEEILHYFFGTVRRRNLTSLLIDEGELNKRKRSIEVSHALEWALANDGVEMFYQPIYDIRAGRFSALEALARIRDENGNIIMPDEFIELAEKNGKILELGKQIFKSVCRFISQNKIENFGIEYVEVNLSVVQCMQDDLAKTYMEIMSDHNVPPHMINLEITETAAVNSKETLRENMNKLLSYGNTFSLDDYGTGYSNLIYVIQMPLHIIKIDRDLTLAYGESDKAKTATEYTVEMAHELGLEIVVEGIETEEQYLAFKKLGVEYIQGYYFSRPLSKDRVLSFVQEWL